MQSSVKKNYNSRNTRAAASAKLQNINPDMAFDFSYKNSTRLQLQQAII
jgi:hypothetical protein